MQLHRIGEGLARLPRPGASVKLLCLMEARGLPVQGLVGAAHLVVLLVPSDWLQGLQTVEMDSQYIDLIVCACSCSVA